MSYNRVSSMLLHPKPGEARKLEARSSGADGGAPLVDLLRPGPGLLIQTWAGSSGLLLTNLI